MTSDAVSNPGPETTQHQHGAPDSLAPIEIRDTNISCTHRPWPDAAVLPLVFPQKICDGVLKSIRKNTDEGKEKVFARIVVSWLKDPTQCSLDIDLTAKGASALADKIFGKCMSYQKDRGIWLLECDDGVEMSVPCGATFDRCSASALRPLLGELVSITFDNNPRRRRELKTGDKMTRLLCLSFGDDVSPSKFRVILDAEML